jgi:hypothetical protein
MAGSVSTTVFGMCATRSIGLVVGFVKDIASKESATPKEGTNEPKPGGDTFTGPRFEEITTEDKKTS